MSRKVPLFWRKVVVPFLRCIFSRHSFSHNFAFQGVTNPHISTTLRILSLFHLLIIIYYYLLDCLLGCNVIRTDEGNTYWTDQTNLWHGFVRYRSYDRIRLQPRPIFARNATSKIRTSAVRRIGSQIRELRDRTLSFAYLAHSLCLPFFNRKRAKTVIHGKLPRQTWLYWPRGICGGHAQEAAAAYRTREDRR